MINKKVGLYLHIPFCVRKCAYCDFYSVPYDYQLATSYVDALVLEIERVAKMHNSVSIDTIYIGGGTPSLLPPILLDSIFKAIYNNFKGDISECTIEVNPHSAHHFLEYKSMGINRISMGVQSLDDRVLKLIGRQHDAQTAISSLQDAHKYFDNVSADLIIGMPTQTMQSVISSIEEVSDYVTHISQYMLKLSRSVPMQADIDRGVLCLPSDDTTCDMYDLAYEKMRELGFKRYEISNFARENKVSLHNLKYWQRAENLACGAGAYSYIDNIRYDNPNNIIEYINGVNYGGGAANAVTLTKEDALFEHIMLGFRLESGFDIAEINRIYDIDFVNKYAKPLNYLGSHLVIDNGRIAVNPKSMLLESAIARSFL
ncbi:MAG: radical SAM family heme chaperone HemW [Bacillota bacterium]